MKKKEVKIYPVNEVKGMLEKLNIKNPTDLASRIHRDFENAEQIKYAWIPQRNDDLKSYFGVIKAMEWPFKGASTVKSQFQRIIVDTLSGNLIKSFFSPEHPLRVDPAPLNQNSSNDTLDNMKYVEDLHNSQLMHEYNLRSVLDKAIPTSLIESFVVLHPVYEYMTNEYSMQVRRWVPADAAKLELSYDPDTDSVTTPDGQVVPSINLDTFNGSPEELKGSGLREINFDVYKEECIKDGVSVKVINGYRFYIPVGSPGENPYDKVQRAPYAIHQMYYTIREVKNLQEEGYFENVEPVIAGIFDRQQELITETKFDRAGFSLDIAQIEYEYVEVLKWCGKWKINGKWREVIVWMDKGSTQILRVEMNTLGIRPYFPLVPFPIDETPYGESLCQIIRPLVKEIDLLMRTITNIALMKAAPPKFFDPASGFNPGTASNFGPNSWIPSRQPQVNIYQPNSPEDPSVAMQMLTFLINIIERITGISEVVQGQTSGKANTTATEVQQAMIRAGVRFDTLFERYKEQIKPMFKFIHKLTLRHMPETKEVMLMGAENKGRLIKIHKSQLEGQYEFQLQGNSIVTEQAELQNAITLANIAFSGGPATAYISYKPESPYYILYNLVRRLNPIALDKILPKPEEVQQAEQQAQQAQRKQEEMAMQMQQGQAQAQQQMMEQEMAMKKAEHDAKLHGHLQDMELKQADHQQKMRHSEQEHRLKLEHQVEQGRVQIEIQKEKAKNAEKEKREGNGSK